jgi:hypothetical protein
MGAEPGVRVQVLGPVEDPTASEALQKLLAQLAQLPSQEIPQALFAFPILLTEPGIELARACSRRSDGGDALATLVDRIEDVRGAVEEDDERWELGNGPFESLFMSVDVELSVEAAATIASTPAMRSQLSLPYVQALCRLTRSLCGAGQAAAAVKMQCLVLAATDEEPVEEEKWALRSEAIETDLDVLRTVATSSEDRRTIATGIERADRFLKQARRRGDRAAQAMALHGIAQVLVEPRFPWATGSRMAILRMLRLARNLNEQLADPVRQLSADDDPPSDAELTAKGIDFLQAAFALAEGKRRGLIAHTLGSLAAHPHREEGSGIEEIDGAYFARVVLEEITEESLRRLRLNACAILSNLDEPWPATELEEVLAMTPSRLLGIVESAEAAQMIVLAISLSEAETQEAAALRLAVGSYDRLRELTDEELWLGVLKMAIGPLTRLGPDVRLIDDESDAARRARQLLHRAFDTEERRVFAETAKTVIAKLKPGEKTGEDELNDAAALARASIRHPPRGQVPSLLALDEGLALELPSAYRDSLLYSRASLQGDIAVARHHQGDIAGAVADIIESAECWGRLGALDAAGEAVQILGRIAIFKPTTGELKAIVAALGPASLRLESLLGRGGQEVMASTWGAIVKALTEAVIETQSHPEAGILDVVVNAGRHSTRRRSRAPVELVGFAEALQSAQGFIDEVRSPSAAREALIDAGAEQVMLEVAACSRYVQRPPVSTALGPAAESDNLKRYFDWMFCAAELAAKAAAPTEPDPDLACLGSSGVLIEGFLTANRSMPTVLATVFTDEGLKAVTPMITNGLESMLVEVAGQLDVIGALQTIAFNARWAAQQHSGPREVTAEAAEILSDNWLLGESADSILAMLAEQGKSRLYVVAPDAFAFAPLHLSGAAGHPLAERWQISYLPDASWLRPAAPRGQQEALGALGLDFAGLELPTLEDAVAEAEEIAGTFGGNALLNRKATVRAARETLATCTIVHFATHGAFDPAAPSFQRLYLSDGNGGTAHLFASDLYDLDLRHVRLVTLGACETALGRIDVGGNQRGFVGALFQRGVRTVVAALWRVDSGCSCLFFTELYRQLAAGCDCHVAFAAAQARARETYPGYRQWGAFVLIGGVGD